MEQKERKDILPFQIEIFKKVEENKILTSAGRSTGNRFMLLGSKLITLQKEHVTRNRDQ